jgi:hypothetical protein
LTDFIAKIILLDTQSGQQFNKAGCMFSFFDKHSMEAANLNDLLTQIKELLIKISFTKLPMIHQAEDEIHCFLYLDVSHLYDKDYEASTDSKIESALKDLVRLVHIGHCLSEYQQIFNDAIGWFPPDETKIKELDPNFPYSFDLEKALDAFDKGRASIENDYKLLQVKIAEYLHHLIFLETNTMLSSQYFSVPPKAGELFNATMVNSLEKQGILEKNDKKILQDKILNRHKDIVTGALFTVYMDCGP